MSDGIFTGLRGRDLGIVASTWMRFAFRSGGGVVALFIILVVGLFLPSVMLDQARDLLKRGEVATSSTTSEDEGQTTEENAQSIDAMARVMFSAIFENRDADQTMTDVDFLTTERPAVMSMLLVLLLYLVPFAACAASFNQFAGDIGNRGLRFVLSRTERPNIFLGRFISAACFLALAFGILVFVATLYVMLRFPIYERSAMMMAGVEGWFVLLVFGLPYVALCSWISSTQRSAFVSLTLCYVGAIVPMLLIKVIVNSLGGLDIELNWLRLLTPWDWRHDMFSASGIVRMKGHGAMLGFTAVFLLLGLLNFKKRDL